MISLSEMVQLQQQQQQQHEFSTTVTPLLSPEDHMHHYFMGLALDEAHKAAQQGEVPVGAVVVRNVTTTAAAAGTIDTTRKNPDSQQQQFLFQVLSYGSNRVETNHDASAHAELEALRQAAAVLDNWRLLNCTLYSTLEPCPMCLAAAQAFRLQGIVYGAPDLRLGAVQTHVNLQELAAHPFHNVSVLQGGIRQDECAQVLRDFFRERRTRGRDPPPPQKQATFQSTKRGGKEPGSSSKKWKTKKRWWQRPFERWLRY